MNDLPNQFDAAHKVASFPSIRPSVPERTTGERRKFRTIWISDVHLGTKGCNHELLIDFLDHTDSETLYLVGDIIDGWRLKKKFYWPASHNDIVWRILKRAKRGTRIVYIPGNHDEVVRPFCGMNFGDVEIRRAAFHAVPAAFETMLPPTLRRRSANVQASSRGSEASFTHASEAHCRN